MGDWVTRSLGELIEEANGFVKTGPFGTQLHAHEYTDDETGIPVVMPRDMKGGRVDVSGVKRVPPEVADRLDVHRMKANDIVLARRGDIGRLAALRDEEAGWICGTGSMRIHVGDADKLDPGFLRFALMNPASIEWLQAQAVGATMPNLNDKIVADLPLATPCIEVQRRIAALFASLEKLIETNERRIELLEDLARSLYREWFVHFRFPGHERAKFKDSEVGSIPENWEVVELRELAEIVVDGVDPGSIEPDIPYVGLEHLGRRRTTLLEWGSPESVKSRKLSFIAGDTLFGKIRPYFHKVVWAPFDGVASSDMVVFRAREECTTPATIALITSSDRFVAEAVAGSNGTKMPRADTQGLLSFRMAAPPPELVRLFEGQARSVLDSCASLVRQMRRLADTRDLFLPRLVSGKLDISDIDLGVLEPEGVA